MADRFSDVIGKMEEETKKIERKKKIANYEKKISDEVEEKTTRKTTKKVADKNVKKQAKHVAPKRVKAEVKETKKKEIEKEKVEQKQEKVIENIKEENEEIELPIEQEEQEKDLFEKEKELQEIREAMKKETSLPEEKAKKIYLKMFLNIVLAIVVLGYFMTLNVLHFKLESAIYNNVLNISSIVLILVTIILYEIAYKKDSGTITIHGIEAMVISVGTILAKHFNSFYSESFKYSLTIIGVVFVIYYIIKSIVVHILEKKKTKREMIEKDKEEMR